MVVQQGQLVIDNPQSLGATESQKLTVTTGSLADTFTLTFEGKTTAPLAINVPASGGVGPTASVQNALNALSTISGAGGSVLVTQTGNVYTINFLGTLAQQPLPQIIAIPTGTSTVQVNTVVNAGGTTVESARPWCWKRA